MEQLKIKVIALCLTYIKQETLDKAKLSLLVQYEILFTSLDFTIDVVGLLSCFSAMAEPLLEYFSLNSFGCSLTLCLTISLDFN